MRIEPADELALVTRAQRGDRDAMEQLLRDHQPRIHAVCRRLTGNDTDALDATQEALIAVVRGLPRFNRASRFSTWAYRVATNACLDELRRRRRRPVVGLGDDAAEWAGGEDDGAPSLAEQVSNSLTVDAALQELPVEFRAAVVLRDLCQLDYAEIAEVLAIPAGTVRSRIARGRRQLGDLLGNQDLPPDRHITAP